MHLVQNEPARVFVLLLDIAGQPILAATSVSAYVLKANTLTPAALTLSASNWHEVGTEFPGLYVLTLAASDTDVLGPLAVSVKASGADYAMSAHLVVAAMAEDARVAADLACQLVGNNYKVDTQAATLTIFGNDGVTPLRVFHLKDELGAANASRIYERTL